MRPVNADKLKEELQYFIECADWGNGVNAGLETAIEVIDNAVTMDVTPTVHAHWVEAFAPTWGGYHWYCSGCGGHIITRYPDYPDDKYCPYCGALMDEEEHK